MTKTKVLEETMYKLMLDYLLEFHAKYNPEIITTFKRLNHTPKINGKHISSGYRLEVKHPWTIPGLDNIEYVKHGFNAETLKELYETFVEFREEIHFFRKDMSLEEIEMQLTIRGDIDVFRRNIQDNTRSSDSVSC